jgi:hypothetical protein
MSNPLTTQEVEAIKTIGESQSVEFLVTALELSAQLSGVDTISETARKNKISPNGVKTSKRYRKIKIGKQLMAVQGLDHKNLPF